MCLSNHWKSAYMFLDSPKIELFLLEKLWKLCQVGENICLEVDSSHKPVCSTVFIKAPCYWVLVLCLLSKSCQCSSQIPLKGWNCCVLGQPSRVLHLLTSTGHIKTTHKTVRQCGKLSLKKMLKMIRLLTVTFRLSTPRTLEAAFSTAVWLALFLK